MIDIYVKEGKIDEAKKLFREQSGFNVTNDFLDFHDYSYGAGIVAILIYIEDNPTIPSFGVIPGKGLHSKHDLGEFKKVITEYVKDKLLEWDVKECEGNPGCLKLSKKT